MEPLTAERRHGAPAEGVTPAELREAERGLRLMLARKFSAAWIAENASDVLAQANTEYAEWLQRNPPARNPVGWLLTCAYRRALNLLDKQTRRPRSTPLDSVFHLADESTPTPEQQALDNDRQRRLSEALGHLPPKERRLLALVYFEGLSIREAGRKLGWQKSAADRHHAAAMKRMRAMVGDRKLLSPASLGIAAWVLARGEGRHMGLAFPEGPIDLARSGAMAVVESLSAGAHRLGELWRRLSPFAEPANAAAASGAGRATGYCAAAAGAVICGLAATGAVGPVVSSVEADRVEASKTRLAEPVRRKPSPEPSIPQPSKPSEPSARAKAPRPDNAQAKRSEPQSRPRFAPPASTQDTVTEFGLERESGGSSESASEPGGEQASTSAPRAPSPAPRSPASAPSTEFGL